MQTMEYIVTFKQEAGEKQQKTTFTHPAAAYAFAVSIESEGGIAIVTPQIKSTPHDSTNPIDLKGTW